MKCGDRSSCRVTASSVPGGTAGGDGWLGSAGVGALVCWRDKSKEEVEEKKWGSSCCIAGYQTLASRLMRIRLWLCSEEKKIERAIRKALGMLYLGSPHGRPGPHAPSRRGTGSWRQGNRKGFGDASPKGSHPGPGTGQPRRNIPAMWGGLAASTPATSAPPAGPASPSPPAACTGMHQPGADQAHASVQTGRQLPAAGCCSPARQGPAELTAGLPASPAGRFRQLLARGWDAPASSLTHQRKGVRWVACFHSVGSSL